MCVWCLAESHSDKALELESSKYGCAWSELSILLIIVALCDELWVLDDV